MKIKTVRDSGRDLPDGKKIFDVWIEGDDKKYSCFNAEIETKVGQEVDATITEKVNGQFKNYILSLKKDFGSKPFVKSNSDKQTALECAVNWLVEKPDAKKENVIQLAEFFLEWLKK